MTTEVSLATVDYLVFAGLIAVSLVVGIVIGFRDRNQSADNYLLNNEHMNPYAAGLSIFVSMLSALTIIGLPVEVYLYGNAMVWRLFGGIVGTCLVNYTFLPKVYELKLYSIFAYTQMRYKSKLVTNLTMCFGLGALLFHLMSLSYLTALAFSTVIGMSDWASLLFLNTVAIVYTMCGGMKAVVWTDCLQSFVMLFSLTFVCIQLWSVLGAKNILNIVEYSNGNQWKDLNFSLLQRTSSWGYFSSEMLFIWTRVGFGQYFMQRCVACKSLKDARLALVVGLGIALLVGAILTPMTGMAAIAFFDGCDPVKSKELEKYDQIMPYLAAQIFKEMPGMTGVFVSSAYSATLSTMSTGLNSFATVTFKTILNLENKSLSAEKLIKYQRIFMFAFGYVVVIAAYILKFLPDTVLSGVFVVTGGLGTCSALSFVCGMSSPRVNRKGIIYGYIVSSIPILLGVLGLFKFKRDPVYLNSTFRNDTLCDGFNTTLVSGISTAVFESTETEAAPKWHVIFWVSPYFQTLIVGIT